MNYEHENSKQLDWIIRVQIGLSILFSGSAVSFSFRGSTSVYVHIALTLFVFCTILCKYKAKLPIYKDKANRYIISVIVIVLASSFINISSFSPTVTGICILSLVQAFLLVYYFDTGEEAIKAFVFVMRFFAYTGLICWVVFEVIGVTRSWMPIIRLASNSVVSYRSIFIHNFIDGVTRNAGPFWEPSIYASYLIIGMLLSHFVLHEKTNKLLPLFAALLSAQSSGGTMMLFIFIILLVWDSNGENKSNSNILKATVILCMLLVVFFWDNVQSMLLNLNPGIFSKIIQAMNDHQSETRLMSFVVDLEIWKESPIFGVGVSAMEVRFLALRDIIAKITSMSHTSTSTEYIAAFGIGGLWINLLWIKAVFQNRKSTVFNIGVALIFFIMLNEVSQINFVLTYFLLFSLLKLKYSYQLEADYCRNDI